MANVNCNGIMAGDGKRKELVIDLIMMASIFSFLLCYFEPRYLFSCTTTTGGDTGSHYYTAQYLRDYLIPRLKISGWCQGNLAGFPMLQYYFPFPFLIMAALSWIMPLQIAFKLVTTLGIFLLPPCTYLFFRLLKQPYPVPIIGAVFSLPFLFMEGNSMWGANIPSTLAGEFCYSLGFALSILWLGLLYDTISGQKGYLRCSILLALIGLCHGYVLIFVVIASTFFLFTTRRFGQNLKTLLRIHLVALSLMAFWLVPLVAFLPYTTRFSILWIFFDWGQFSREALPSILYPLIGLSLAATTWAVIKKLGDHRAVSLGPWAYTCFMVGAGLGLYLIGYRIGVVDVRFLPYFQFFLVIGGTLIFSLFRIPPKASIVLGFICLLLTLLWVDHNEKISGNWIKSNYRGFEQKRLWQAYSSINQSLKGTTQDPRVVYEHSMLHKHAGTVRAFEALPLFSGRSTLEGVYIQASLCVPFLFYLQSEVSQRPSTPIPDYNYSRFDLKRGAEHLKLFNVRHFIAVEPETKEAVRAFPEFQFHFRSGPYEVYELLSNPNRYVEPAKYKPVLLTTKDWRKVSYRWFRLSDLSVPLVFKNTIEKEESERFNIVDSLDLTQLPKSPLEPSVLLKETVREEEIIIDGATKGRPLVIKISYHPNWKVEGADRIYLVSPAFMLVYPNKTHVRLYYGWTWPDYLGALTTAVALLFMLFSCLYNFEGIQSRLSRWFDRYVTKAAMVFILTISLAATYYLIYLSPEFPVLSYNKGIEHFTKKDYTAAKKYFKDVLERHPQTLIVDQAAYHYAMCFFREKDWDNTIKSIKWFLATYPETRRAAEARYHIGLCYKNLGAINEARKHFKTTIKEFPKEIWARFAGDRLKEMQPL